MSVLGIDTSNYTTSVAVLDEPANLIAQQRRLLQVPAGSHGLRQSEAVFQHLQNLPDLVEQLAIDFQQLSAVGVSVRPRDQSGSYMPVFTVGANFARVLARGLSVPVHECSHQANHLAAALWSLSWWPEQGEEFIAAHVSGGTSEILHVRWSSTPSVTVLGATRDLNAGQFVDRVGVALGLDFPAGPQLEQLARKAKGEVRLASPVEGCDMSFSGPLSAALRLVGQSEPTEIARGVEDCVAKGLEKALLHACDHTRLSDVLLVGGVISNQRIRQRLDHRLRGLRLRYASLETARDHAIGAAVLAWKN
ncbi:MAG: O-sialoglycoprotein endopeptidase [Firmicutes bacterium]|nr:O-sialoglycoprotein endopeptidase [Bacillota bacterium]